MDADRLDDPFEPTPEPITAAERRVRTEKVETALSTLIDELDRLDHMLAAADIEMALHRLRRFLKASSAE